MNPGPGDVALVRAAQSGDAGSLGLLLKSHRARMLAIAVSMLGRVWTALERLSEPLRLVATLRYFTGAQSYEAIAEICGVPVGSVRSRLSAAKARLADELLRTATQVLHHSDGPVRRVVSHYAPRDPADVTVVRAV